MPRAKYTLSGEKARFSPDCADKNAEILALDSMQSLTAEDGQDYISVMEKNLEVLEKALD